MKTKIFYSHSKKTFNTPKEEKEMRILTERYPKGVIICPNHDFKEFKDARVCNTSIDNCDLIIVSECEGFIDMDEFIAVTRAFSNRIPVFGIQKLLSEYLFFEVSGIEIVNENDWVSQYAKLI